MNLSDRRCPDNVGIGTDPEEKEVDYEKGGQDYDAAVDYVREYLKGKRYSEETE